MSTVRLTLSGVAATRRSYGRRSLMMATFIAARFLALPGGQGNGAPIPRHPGDGQARTRSAGAFLALFAPEHKPTALEIVIDIERQIEIVEHLAAPAMQHKRTRAIVLDDVRHVRGQDQAAIGPFLEQLLVRAALKALIADREDFVD